MDTIGTSEITTIQIVSFIMDTEEYGIDILNVREIIRITELTPIPMSPKEILGVINLRGNIIPIINFRTLFSLPTIPTTNDTRIIVIEHHSIIIGVLVDCVSEVLTVQKDSIDSAPPNIKSDMADFINEVIVLKEKDSLLLLVDVEKLFMQNQALLVE